MSDDRSSFQDVAFIRLNADGTTVFAVGCSSTGHVGGTGVYDITIKAGLNGQAVPDSRLKVTATPIGATPRLVSVSSVSDDVKRITVLTAAGAAVDNALSVTISAALPG